MAKRSQGRESEDLDSTIHFIIHRLCDLGNFTCLLWTSDSSGKLALLFHSWYEGQIKCFGKSKVFWYHNYLFVIQNFSISKQSIPSLLCTQSQTTHHMHTRWQRSPLSFTGCLVFFMSGSTDQCQVQSRDWEGTTLAPTGKTAVTRLPHSSLEEGEEAEMSPGLQANWQWSLEWRQKLTDLLTLMVSLAYWRYAVFILSTLHHPKYPSHLQTECQVTGDTSAPNICTQEAHEAPISKVSRSAPGWGYYQPSLHPLLWI